MRSRIVIAFPLLLATCAAAQAGNYYKWTDAQGSVHYSQSPPLDKPSKSVHVNDGAPVLPMPGINGAPVTPKQKAQAQAGQAALQSANTEAVGDNCTAAQRNIGNLEGRGLVVRGGDPANAHALDPQARQDALADARKQAATYCTKEP